MRSQWHRDMPFEAMIRLRDHLDSMLQQIRSERQIRSPQLRCPNCGHVGEGKPPHVSVRAMISMANVGHEKLNQLTQAHVHSH